MTTKKPVTEYVDPWKYYYCDGSDYVRDNSYAPIQMLLEDNGEWSAGWYFSDECQQLHGPFSTIEEANQILNDYIKEFLG